MQNNVPIVKLGDILTERLERPDLEAVMTGEIPIIAKIGFNDGTIEFREGFDTKTNMILVKPGDLVISGINAMKGAVALYEENNLKDCAATIHYSSYSIEKKRADPKFLWFFFRSEQFRNILIQSLPNGIKTEIKPKRLLKIEIPLPSIEKQKKTVQQLNIFFEKINSQITIHRESRKLSKYLIEDVIEKIFNPLEKGYFEEVITLKPRSGPAYPTDPTWKGIPVVMPSAVTNFGFDPTKIEYGIGNEKINQKDFIKPGDVMIARGNKPDQVGNAGIATKEAEGWVCANLLMRIQFDEQKTIPEFCIYWLRSPFMRRYVKKHMKGTSPSIQKINQQIILKYPYPNKISVSDQRRIVDHLDRLQAKVDEVKQLQGETEKEIEALVPAVLAKAFGS